MRNYNILFISFPALVAVNPSAPIVSTLVRRGHRVTYPTTVRIAARLAATGAEIILYPTPNWCPETNWEEWQMSHIEELLLHDKKKPDVVVYDLVSPAGAALASRMRVPAVMTSNYLPLNETRFNETFRGQSYPNMYRQSCRVVDHFLERHGVPSVNYLFEHREKLNIYLFPSEFSPDVIGDDRCFYSGRCPGEQIAFGCWTKGDDDDHPIVLVATSTTYIQGANYFRMCVDALAETQWRVIFSIADDADPASLFPLPPNFEIVQRTSHTRILPHASLLIFLGGIVTSSEAAYHGVPMVITSCGNDELEGLGDNLSQLGLGIHLKGNEMTPESLRKCARQVLESATILRNVKKLQRSVRRQAGAEEAANRIEEFIETNI